MTGNQSQDQLSWGHSWALGILGKDIEDLKLFQSGFHEDLKLHLPYYQDWQTHQLNVHTMPDSRDEKPSSIWRFGAGWNGCFETWTSFIGRPPKQAQVQHIWWPVSMGSSKGECSFDGILRPFQYRCGLFSLHSASWGSGPLFWPPPPGPVTGSDCCLHNKVWIFSLLEVGYHAAYTRLFHKWGITATNYDWIQDEDLEGEKPVYYMLTICLLSLRPGWMNPPLGLLS